MAEQNDIPADVRSLITRDIDSVIQLELLLLLHQRRDRAWTADEIATELRIEPAWTAAQLDQLRARRLLRVAQGTTGGYQYDPGSLELGNTIDALAAAYANRRVSLVAMIYSKPTDSLRTFADAFRFRKEPRDG